MSNHQCSDCLIRCRIVVTPETSRPQVHICRDFTEPSIVVFNLRKQFQNSGSFNRKILQRHTRDMAAVDDHYLPITVMRNRNATMYRTLCRGRLQLSTPLPPRTIHGLIAALITDCDQLPQKLTNCFISSMKSPC